MRHIRAHLVRIACVLCVLGSIGFTGTALAEPWIWVSEGQAPQGRWTAGLRAGFSILTQEFVRNTSTDIGPAINAYTFYGLNRWLNVGLMVEWERRTTDQESPKLDVGTLNTVSVLPTVEVRPGRYGAIMPYASAGIGVNVNSFSESNPAAVISPANTFAFRLAGGADYPLTSKLMLNTELAWKRNRGGIEIGPGRDNFDASSFNVLFGVRYVF